MNIEILLTEAIIALLFLFLIIYINI